MLAAIQRTGGTPSVVTAAAPLLSAGLVPSLAPETRAAAMLRSAGFRIVAHPEEEVFLCQRIDVPPGPDGPRAVYPARQREGG